MSAELSRALLFLAPIVILLGGAYVFMRVIVASQANVAEQTKRQADALDRIAAALEKRQ